MTTSSAAPAITVAAAILMILMFRFMSHPSIRQFNAGDLLEIHQGLLVSGQLLVVVDFVFEDRLEIREDRKSTRLNSSHGYISYAVFCLKKKNSVDCNFRNLTTVPPRAA